MHKINIIKIHENKLIKSPKTHVPIGNKK